MKLIFYFLTFLFAIVKSEISAPGKCPDVPALIDINREKILGRWYCVKYFPNLYQDNLKCTIDNVTFFDENKLQGFFTSIKKSSNEKLDYSYAGTYRVNSSIADFASNVQVQGMSVKMDIKLIDTDYDNYLTAWSCVEIDSNSYRFAWVQTRTNTISDEIFAKVKKFFDKYNLDSSKFADTDQINC